MRLIRNSPYIYHECSKCSNGDFAFMMKGNQLGIYCSKCGKWLKWADKDEQNLYEMNKPSQNNVANVLDKIRAEIEELDRYYDNDYFSTNNCPMYKCNDVLQIIDKYRKEQT